MAQANTALRIREIALKDIDRSRNHRIPRPGDAERIEFLKKTIAVCGQLQAIRVYERGEHQKDPKHKEPYILGYGWRRCEAMESLDRKMILGVIFPPATDSDIAQARLIENIGRQDITPMEEVLAVSDMLEAIKAENFTGDIYEEAAARFGCEVSWVKDRDYLHRLTKPVQQFSLRSGLPLGHLRELAKVGDPSEQMRLACLAAGAPPQAFPADPKEKVAQWQRQLQERYFAELADGKIQRWPLSELKDQVARERLSLRATPWQFDQPVHLGATKLRKCAGCPHNSETDRTLFGIDEDAAEPNGYCLNFSCYTAKYEATEAASATVFKKISTQDDQSRPAIRKILPPWLKEEVVVAYAKRQRAKATTADSQKPASKSKAKSNVPQFTEHEATLIQFREAHEKWTERASVAIAKGLNADPLLRLSWCVLQWSPSYWYHPEMEWPQRLIANSTQPCTEQPVFPPLPERIEEAIRLAFKGTRNVWMGLLEKHKVTGLDFTVYPTPRMLELLAEVTKVELPPMPQWEAMKPRTEAKSPAESNQTVAV